MAKLTTEQVAFLERLKECVEEGEYAFKPFHEEFADSMVERFSQYGANTIISSRQWEILTEIGELIGYF